MRFHTRHRRQAPPIIIISLIDIMIVLLIFMMATTTFKQRPAVKITLPESKRAKSGSAQEGLMLTMGKGPPYLWLSDKPVTFEQLQQELRGAIIKNPNVSLTLSGDTNAPYGLAFQVMDLAADLHIPMRLAADRKTSQ